MSQHSEGSWGKLASLSLFLGVFYHDLLSMWSSSVVPGALIAISIVALPVDLVARKSSRRSTKNILILTLSLLAAWALGSLASGTINRSAYLLAPILGLVGFLAAPQFFMKLLSIHLAVSVSGQLYEYFSGTYLYVYQASNGVRLDRQLFSGLAEINRTKGLFQGPLSAVAFSAWLAFLHPKSVRYALVLITSAFLAAGRLGMVVGGVLFTFRIFYKNRSFILALLKGQLIAVATFAAIVVGSSDARLTFIANAFNMSSSQNTGRIHFWISAISQYLSYPISNILWGSFGYISEVQLSTENDFVRILLDDGLIAFSLYVGVLFLLFRRSIIIRDIEFFLCVALIFVMMNIFPFIQSLNSGVLFWFFSFSRLRPSLPLVSRGDHTPNTVVNPISR